MSEVVTKKYVKPKLAFIGTGWIGLNRMKSLLQTQSCEVHAISDVEKENADNALELAPRARNCRDFDEVIASKPDGIVIATPSALHARQSIYALEHGIPVFCQKPLARNSVETYKVIKAARNNNRLLGVDMSYRYTDGIQKIYQLNQQKELGEIYAVDLTFHNAYGPDKSWFYNPSLSGGGCLIDLGIHLMDLALWMLDFPGIKKSESVLYSKGEVIEDVSERSEDYVAALLQTSRGTSIRLTCSWNLPAGKDADINATFYGTKAAAAFSNVEGSFYDFETRFNQGTLSKVISKPPDDWGGRALQDWTKRLGRSNKYNPAIVHYAKVAETIDVLYNRNIQ